MKVLIVVTHLLGTGHLRRAVMLARGFAAAGHQARVISGGTQVRGLATEGIGLMQLPPLKSDGTRFTALLTEDGMAAPQSYLAMRQDRLLDALAEAQPDVLITELFPFGRRVLAPEFTALLQAALAQDAPPLILCSIRDILAPPSKPGKAAATEELIARLYDGVLVHSDATATPLSISWPVSDLLAGKLHYTGFVAPSPPGPHPDQAGTGEVLVSAGGGAVGAPLFQAAREAARRTPELTWRILAGGTDPVPLIKALRQNAPANLIAEAARPDFRQMLSHAACSVSMAGYNTAMDLMQTGCPALLIPFDDGGEVEQSLRAKSLAHLPGIEAIRSVALTPEGLAKAVRRLAVTPRRATGTVAMNGVSETVRITETLRNARR